jgi:hypothetical protein
MARGKCWFRSRTVKQLLELSGDVAERLDPVFFSDPAVAVQKAFGGS